MDSKNIFKIHGELTDSDYVRTILENSISTKMERIEEMLHERQSKIKREVEQVKVNLENDNLTEEIRRNLQDKLQILEASPVSEHIWLSSTTLLEGVDWIKDEENEVSTETNLTANCFIFSTSYDDCLRSSVATLVQPYQEWLFVGEYTNDNKIEWRAEPFEISSNFKSIDISSHVLPRRQKPNDQCPRGIDKDSVSHFQNCPIPPGITSTAQIITHIQPNDMLTKNGCLASITPTVTNEQQTGGIEWTDTKTESNNASISYRKLQVSCQRKSKVYWMTFRGFLTATKNLQKKPFLTLSVYKQPLSCKIIQRRLLNSASCLPLSGYTIRANEEFYKGAIN